MGKGKGNAADEERGRIASFLGLCWLPPRLPIGLDRTNISPRLSWGDLIPSARLTNDVPISKLD